MSTFTHTPMLARYEPSNGNPRCKRSGEVDAMRHFIGSDSIVA